MHWHLVATRMTSKPNRAQVLLVAVSASRKECVSQAADLKRARRYRSPWSLGIVDCPRPLDVCQPRIVGQSG